MLYCTYCEKPGHDYAHCNATRPISWLPSKPDNVFQRAANVIREHDTVRLTRESFQHEYGQQPKPGHSIDYSVVFEFANSHGIAYNALCKMVRDAVGVDK